MASFNAWVCSICARVSIFFGTFFRFIELGSSAYAPVLLERKAARIRQEMEQDAEKARPPQVIRTVFQTADRQYVAHLLHFLCS